VQGAAEKFGAELRTLQSNVKCTNKTLLEIIQLFAKYTGQQALPINLAHIDKKLQQQAGCSFFRLHGCPHGKCEHVYEPGDDATHCPRCGKTRYHENGKQPLEVRFSH